MSAVVTCRFGGPTEFQAPTHSFHCVLSVPLSGSPIRSKLQMTFGPSPSQLMIFSIYSIARSPPWGLYNPQPLQPIIIKLGQFYLYNMSWSSPFPIRPLPPHNWGHPGLDDYKNLPTGVSSLLSPFCLSPVSKYFPHGYHYKEYNQVR